MSYEDSNFTHIREKHVTAAGISTPGIGSGYVGSTLRSFTKAMVIGCTVRVGSGGSIAGSNSFEVSRQNALGTVSTQHSFATIISAGASAAGDVFDMSLTSGFTLHSAGEAAILEGNAASLDKIAVLSDIIWRYRFLYSGDAPFNASLG
jgi:hypothetical protein